MVGVAAGVERGAWGRRGGGWGVGVLSCLNRGMAGVMAAVCQPLAIMKATLGSLFFWSDNKYLTEHLLCARPCSRLN